MVYKYLKLMPFAFCLMFLGCIFRSCDTTLKIINENSKGEINLIEDNGKFIKYEIENNESKYFDKKIMEKILYVYIKNEKMEGIFELREYDHWFFYNHNIEIIVGENEYIINNDRKNIYFEYSYDTYTNREDEIIDFEIIKEINYKNIYEIIKNK